MLDLKSKDSDPVTEVRQVQHEKKKELLGTIQPHPGHILFEVNLKEKTIVPATFEEQEATYPRNKPKSEGLGVRTFEDGSKKLVIDKLPSRSKTLIRKENCIYIPALNRRNVLKKLVKKGIIKILKNKEDSN